MVGVPPGYGTHLLILIFHNFIPDLNETRGRENRILCVLYIRRASVFRRASTYMGDQDAELVPKPSNGVSVVHKQFVHRKFPVPVAKILSSDFWIDFGTKVLPELINC